MLPIVAVLNAIVVPVVLPVKVAVDPTVLSPTHSVRVHGIVLMLEPVIATIMLAIELIVLTIMPIVSVIPGHCRDCEGQGRN